MDLKDVYELLDKFDASACCEMELNLNGTQLSLKKYSSIAVPSGLNNVVAGNTQTQAEQVTDNASAGDAVEIKAPLVGTFYQAPGPDDQPYVKVGQQVKKGDVVGIIEAMKLMNEVVAPQDGVVASIDVAVGDAVESGALLATLNE